MSAELNGRLTPSGVLVGNLNQTGGGGTDNYNDLVNKPSINGVTLAGNKTSSDLGINIPTKVSQLQNDSHYVQQSAIPTKTSQLMNDSGFAYTANLATVALTGSYNNLTDKPTIPAAQVNSDWNSNSGVSQILNKPNLAAVATSGSYDDLTDKPTIPAAQVNSDWNSNSGVSQILNKPNLAAVATSGSYDDLTDKPTIPAAQVNSDWNSNSGVSQILNKPNLAAVATSGSYNDLTNKPNLEYKVGDTISMSAVICAGIVATTKKDVRFFIPLSKPISSNVSGVTINGRWDCRSTLGQFTNDTLSNYGTITTTILENGVYVRLQSTNDLNVDTNMVVSAYGSSTASITFT